MFGRAAPALIIVLSIMICFAGATQAQNQTRIVSEPCKALQNVSAREIDQKIGSLEASVKDLKRARSQVSSQARARLQEIDEKIRAAQESLIDLEFARECFRRDIRPDPALVQNAENAEGKRGPADWVALTVYYATDRVATGESAGVTTYGSDRVQQPGYGRVEVSIPTSRRAGTLPLPSLWQLELNADPSKHFILKSVRPLNNDVARAELSAKLAAADAKSVLIFVHGFNVTFAGAALRTAQMAHDLAFPGLAMFFSWPSAGQTRSYFRDEEISRLSEPAFNQMLDDVAALGPTEIYLIAHSMGNRIVTSVLKDRARQNQPIPKISELLLAAPDVNEQLFREQIVPALASAQSVHRTIYASSNDVALKASKVAHEFRRIGDTDGGVLTFTGYETIDATAAAPVVRAFGHSYVMDSPRVLSDIADILIRRKPVAQRGLDRKQATPTPYWLLR